MRNQPHSQWQVIDAAAEQRESAWSLDRQVELRTWLLIGVAIIGLCVIALRISQLKVYRQQSFLENANPITIREESIPAVDGRIFSSDGQLLAYDDERFNVSVHYRWLEDPPDPRWLRSQVKTLKKRSLELEEFSDEAAEKKVWELRKNLWQKLILAGKITPEEFEATRAKIQRQIEGIAEVVDRNQLEKKQKKDAEQEEHSGSFSSWDEVWKLVKSELTEPPSRGRPDPIVIREELDYHPIIENVSTAVVAEIESHPSEYPGVRIAPSTTRIYPRGNLASHIIGLRSSLREDQIRERRAELEGPDPLAYQAGDRQGRFGVERSYNSILRGLPGSQKVSLARAGDVIKTEKIRSSQSGSHLILSLHSQLQLSSEEMLDELISPEPNLIPPLPDGLVDPSAKQTQGGCVLMMNIYSGELLAAASSPRPDLQKLAIGSSDYWQELNSDKRAPLLSRVTQVLLAPGSTFKPVTAVALCETEGVPQDTFQCRGFLDDPFSHRCAIFQLAGIGHEDINLTDAIAQSCNVYFFAAARRMGAEPLVKWCDRLGFGNTTGVDLPFEQSGHVPAPRDNQPEGKYQWYPGDNLGLSIGQSYLTVTPLQMLTMTALIANGGELVTPRVVSRIASGGENSQKPDIIPPVKSKQIPISPETITAIQSGMKEAVASPKGTAHKTTYLKEIAIAGKTGTAQTGGNRDSHAWFVGYVPAEQPQYAFVIMLEHGGSGGADAGPLAKKLVQSLMELGFVEPTD